MRYSSDRNFHMLMYSISHSILLLRSPKKEDDGNNIDIEFWGTLYVDLPIHFNEISINLVNNSKIPEKIIPFLSKIDETNYCTFEITCKESVFYIIASGCRIGENNWSDENRILNPYLEYERVTGGSVT